MFPKIIFFLANISLCLTKMLQLEVHFTWYTSNIINAHTDVVSPSGQWHKWKLTSQIVGPLLHKTKNQDIKFKKKSRLCCQSTSTYQILRFVPLLCLLASYQMIPWMFSSHSVPSPERCHNRNVQSLHQTKRENLNFWHSIVFCWSMDTTQFKAASSLVRWLWCQQH